MKHTPCDVFVSQVYSGISIISDVKIIFLGHEFYIRGFYIFALHSEKISRANYMSKVLVLNNNKIKRF